MTRWTTALLLAGAAVLAGCATKPQMPIALNAAAITDPQLRVGVAMTALPKTDTYLPGASCLLCYAAAAMANSSLTSHAKTLPADELAAIKSEMVAALKKQGVQVVLIDEAIEVDKFPELANKQLNNTTRDFSRLRDKHKIDKLMLISIVSLGFQRNYSSYIPTSDPRAVVRGTGYVVDLKTNALDWWQPIEVLTASNGKWDEPPKFPGLTNAYFQAIEMARDQLLSPLRRQ